MPFLTRPDGLLVASCPLGCDCALAILRSSKALADPSAAARRARTTAAGEAAEKLCAELPHAGTPVATQASMRKGAAVSGSGKHVHC